MSSGSSLLAGIYSGLTNTYAYLAANNPDGVTLESITSATSDSSTYGLLNQSFASYLQANFSSIDTDDDGIISSEEMTNLTTRLSALGLTKAELTQLYASGASGLSSDTMENILEHFDEMDTNGDGRVTSAEISAFSIDCAKQEKQDEYRLKAASEMSVFYGDDSSSSDTYSILSYRYKDVTDSD